MNIFIDTQDMEERYGEELYKEYLEKQVKDYKSRIEKAIDYIKEHKKEITKTEANIFNEDRQDKSKLKVGTFMWNVDELEDILRGGKE